MPSSAPLSKCSVAIIPTTNISSAAGPHRPNSSALASSSRASSCFGCCIGKRPPLPNSLGTQIPMTQPANAKSPLVLLAGPTAVGKSELALLLAEKIGGEIVSVDSMQVYRGLDIGTAKPTRQERAQVRHHLIDVVNLTQPFDAAQFVRRARDAVADIQARGRIPILCGGTGLYFKAFLDGLCDAPKADAALRTELEAAPLS